MYQVQKIYNYGNRKGANPPTTKTAKNGEIELVLRVPEIIGSSRNCRDWTR